MHFHFTDIYAHRISCTSLVELLTGKAELVEKLEKRGGKKKTEPHLHFSPNEFIRVTPLDLT